MQIKLDFDPVHIRENNPDSEAHLEQYRPLFNQSCWLVFEALVKGETLTTDNAKEKAKTRSLPRRIMDLRQGFGITISERWSENGVFKEWFMTDADKVEALKVLVNKINKAA